MKLALALLLTSTAAAQSTLTRTVEAVFHNEDADLQVGSFPRNLFTFGGPFPNAPGLFGAAPLNGVRPVGVGFTFESSIVIRASMTNPTATVMDDGLFVQDAVAEAAGVSDTYGPLSFISAAAFGNNHTVATFQPGETKVLEMHPLNNLVPTSISRNYTPTSSEWCFFETACGSPLPPYLCQLQVLGAQTLTSNVQVNWFESIASHTSTITATLELEELAPGTSAVTFCGPNVAASPADLGAFGSVDAGTSWLSLRVEGVPADSAVALVGASQITTTVANPMGVCIGGMRLVQSVRFADVTGQTTHEVDLAPFQPGDRVAFQALYRTPTGFDVSNGLAIGVR